MGSHKPITKTAAWKHEHEFMNTTTRWDNYPLQTIKWPVVFGNHNEEKRKGIVPGYYQCVCDDASCETPLVSIKLVYICNTSANHATALTSKVSVDEVGT
jgi:hypothetical protein